MLDPLKQDEYAKNYLKIEEPEPLKDEPLIKKSSLFQDNMEAFVYNAKFENDYFADYYDEF